MKNESYLYRIVHQHRRNVVERIDDDDVHVYDDDADQHESSVQL